MRKYIVYILPVFLAVLAICAAAVWSLKDAMRLGLRNTTDEEFKVIGDPSAIKNLSYQFTVSDWLNVWRVEGHGNKLSAVYEPEGESRQESEIWQNVSVNPVFDDNIKKSSMPDSTFTGADDYDDTRMIGGTDKVVYQIYTANMKSGERKKQEDFTFTVRTKDHADSLIECDYFSETPNETLYCSLSGVGNDIYEHARSSMYMNSMSVDEQGYFCISPLQFYYDFSLLDFDVNPGGIYRMKDGMAERLVSLPLGKKDLLYMVSTEQMLYALVMEKGNLFLYSYDNNGKQMDRLSLNIALDDILNPVLQVDQNHHVLVGYNRVYEDSFETYVFNQDKNGLKQIDVVRLSLTRDDVYQPIILQYEQTVLYCLRLANDTIYIEAADHNKILYSSEVYGEYQEDAALYPLDLYNSTGYEKLISRYLFDGRRSIDMLKLLGTR